jgi:outer membrane protein OmpA-like peptidoglycan-associated protein
MADLMKKANAILDSSQNTMQNVTKATANISSISAKIDNGQGTIGALINDKRVYDHLDQTMVGMHDTIVQTQAGVADFEENMEAVKHSFFVRGYFKDRGYENSSELAKDQIANLPAATPLKTFVIDSKQIFDKQTSAKLKNQKSLGTAGDFLSNNEFGLAVVVVYSGMEGDTSKNLVLMQGRAMVVREYLVENFSFDDTLVKTLGLGKTSTISPGAGWGEVQIVVYPTGTVIPPDAQLQNSNSSKSTSNSPVHESLTTGAK